jgi:hypothetical protein
MTVIEVAERERERERERQREYVSNGGSRLLFIGKREDASC